MISRGSAGATKTVENAEPYKKKWATMEFLFANEMEISMLFFNEFEMQVSLTMGKE